MRLAQRLAVYERLIDSKIAVAHTKRVAPPPFLFLSLGYPNCIDHFDHDTAGGIDVFCDLSVDGNLVTHSRGRAHRVEAVALLIIESVEPQAVALAVYQIHIAPGGTFDALHGTTDIVVFSCGVAVW